MAERRMFSKTIIDSDLFMDLPLTAQALYFHLAMRADDDGFIGNSKKLCRMLGVGEDDLALLIEKELLIKFDSGVVAVKHWKVNNLIKNDRYKATIYQEEKSFLEVENNTYRKCEKKPRRAPQKDEKASLEPKWNPSGTHLEPQVRLGKDSIGKVSIGKDSLDKEIECADGTNEPCGSLVSPEGDIAADAASSAPAEQSNKVDFSFSSANAEQPTQNSYSAPSASPKANTPDISADTPKAEDDAPRFDNLVPEEYTKDPQWENHLAEAKARLRRMFGAPKPPKKTDTKPRYGSFDPEEAMAIAIARTEYEFAQMDKNKSS